jgi:hypothetical protein
MNLSLDSLSIMSATSYNKQFRIIVEKVLVDENFEQKLYTCFVHHRVPWFQRFIFIIFIAKGRGKINLWNQGNHRVAKNATIDHRTCGSAIGAAPSGHMCRDTESSCQERTTRSI